MSWLITPTFRKLLSRPHTKGRLLELNENLDVYVIPNGVDTKYISPKIDQEDTGNLLFIGWLKHYLNRDGMIFFLKEIFPLITKEIPNTKIYSRPICSTRNLNLGKI